jgi:hypothetical protein
MLLKIFAKSELILAKRIKKYINPGKVRNSYLSTCEQVMKLMAGKFTNQITEEVKCVTCCYVIVDSTPTISHVDELAVTLRQVKEDGHPVEQFFFNSSLLRPQI